ncbi:MAG: hypothetical protein R2874_03420 [Desulfobacterales bacterium]
MFKQITDDLTDDRLASIAEDLTKISRHLLKSNNMVARPDQRSERHPMPPSNTQTT